MGFTTLLLKRAIFRNKKTALFYFGYKGLKGAYGLYKKSKKGKER